MFDPAVKAKIGIGKAKVARLRRQNRTNLEVYYLSIRYTNQGDRYPSPDHLNHILYYLPRYSSVQWFNGDSNRPGAQVFAGPQQTASRLKLNLGSLFRWNLEVSPTSPGTGIG